MRFVADLHIHSYLSRATSKDLNLEGLQRVAQRKGITVVGTGDFTHPRWLAELSDKLVPAEDGLFALRPDIARAVDDDVPGACRAPVRFMLSVEVSSIYKRGGKVRKVHNLVYAPTIETAARIASRLARIGNIASDGRPILGVDSRDLLEIVLEASPDAFLVPAHIWTPWFSALEAQSGFDRIAECFADLAGHIFAVETGLSSDPAMNWRVAELDRFALVSNSDAHSPEKLGREASLFGCDLSYFALRDALRDRREGFLGTVEFYPEEGKYHHDGHRKCGVSVGPREARDLGGVCPGCGKPLTRGVMSRVEELAERPEGFRPAGAKPFHSLVPLAEVLGELQDAGPASKGVRDAYEKLLARVGPELTMLLDAPPEALAPIGPPLLGEAVRRMRAGDVRATAGYDGEYGIIRVFDDEERRRLLAQRSFGFAASPVASPAPWAARAAEPEPATPSPPDGLSAEQAAAVAHGDGPLLILAGPGTGKTRTVIHRIARLIGRGVSPRAITAISFTRRAARELRERLVALLGDGGAQVAATTFHAFGLGLLRAFSREAGLPADFVVLDEDARLRLAPEGRADEISWAKAHLQPPDPGYERALAEAGAVDFDDLVARSVRLLEQSPGALAWAQERCRYLFVDEYQDVNAAQVRLLALIASPNLCAVGDPDQAIYGFRGSDPSYFRRFADDRPGAATVRLTLCYRCPAAVVNAASWMIDRPLRAREETSPPIERYLAADEHDEADLIAAHIERAVGGTSLYSIDAGRAEGTETLAFHDVAVLYRTSAQAAALGEGLDRAGIPWRRSADAPLTERPQVAAVLRRLRPDGRPVADALRALDDGGDPRIRRAIDLLAALALPFGADAAAFVDELAVLRETDVAREPQKVSLLTLHAAKGLEFPLVFIAGCEDGLVPFRFPGIDRVDRDVEEERRLLYVGMTRAKARLVLTAARRRALFGRVGEARGCPFLRDAPSGLFVDARAAMRPRRTPQLSLL